MQKNAAAKNQMLYIGLFFFFLVLTVFITWRSKHVESRNAYLSPEAQIPTLFVHGYKGTVRSFQNMLYRFEQHYHWGSKKMVITVDRLGNAHIYGALHPNSKHPLIQVVFENNRASIEETAYWLKNVMKRLKKDYSIEDVYIVAHSMGGLVSTKYIEDTNGHAEYPTVSKIVILGSPFQGIDRESYFRANTGKALKDLKAGSAALQQLYNHRRQFSLKTIVLNIVGDNPNYHHSDGVVPVQSALGVRNIVPGENYNEIIVNDEQVTHSGLHESREIDKYIGEFLWGYAPPVR